MIQGNETPWWLASILCLMANTSNDHYDDDDDDDDDDDGDDDQAFVGRQCDSLVASFPDITTISTILTAPTILITPMIKESPIICLKKQVCFPFQTATQWAFWDLVNSVNPFDENINIKKQMNYPFQFGWWKTNVLSVEYCDTVRNRDSMDHHHQAFSIIRPQTHWSRLYRIQYTIHYTVYRIQCILTIQYIILNTL